jgi:hypothetical protein
MELLLPLSSPDIRQNMPQMLKIEKRRVGNAGSADSH